MHTVGFYTDSNRLVGIANGHRNQSRIHSDNKLQTIQCLFPHGEYQQQQFYKISNSNLDFLV